MPCSEPVSVRTIAVRTTAPTRVVSAAVRSERLAHVAPTRLVHGPLRALSQSCREHPGCRRKPPDETECRLVLCTWSAPGMTEAPPERGLSAFYLVFLGGRCGPRSRDPHGVNVVLFRLS
jgi:hypothetical protein